MPLALGPECCCECGVCPTKTEAGLPDALRVAFNVLTSTATGMPADIDLGDCDAADILMRFSHSSAIVALLSEIIYDFIEAAEATGCGCCCFRFEGRKDYSTVCPPGTTNAILLGASPFSPRMIAAMTSAIILVGNDLANPSYALSCTPCDPTPPFTGAGCCCGTCTFDGVDYICHHGLPCIGNTYTWEDGNYYTPLKLHCTSELYICINGSVVTVCLSAAIVSECQVRNGDGTVTPAQRGVCETSPPCGNESFSSGSHTTACTTSTTSSVVLNATADLSAVSGADIWEKMKNAPAEAWVSNYENTHCNCGPIGCSDQQFVQTCGCEYDATACVPNLLEPGVPIETNTGCPESVETLGAPVDIDCLYATGTMSIGFADE